MNEKTKTYSDGIREAWDADDMVDKWSERARRSGFIK